MFPQGTSRRTAGNHVACGPVFGCRRATSSAARAILVAGITTSIGGAAIEFSRAFFKGMTGYKPAKDDFKLSNLVEAGVELTAAQEKEKETSDAATAAHNLAIAAEWALHALHNLILFGLARIDERATVENTDPASR